MKKIMAFVLILSFIGLSQRDLLAMERSGAKILVHTKNGQSVEGELIAVKQKSLLLMDWSQHQDYSVEIKEIKYVDIVKKNYAFLTSIFAGTLVATITGVYLYEYIGFDPGQFSEFFEFYAPIGVGCILLSGMTGAALSSDNRIKIERRSEEEIDLILEKLRKKARVPDYN